MSRTMVILMVVLLVCAGGSAWAAGDLVAHWTFDEWAGGSAGTPVPGTYPADLPDGIAWGDACSTPGLATLPTTTYWTDASYDFGDAVYMFSTTGYISIPEHSSFRFSTQSFSVSFMLKTIPSWRGLMPGLPTPVSTATPTVTCYINQNRYIFIKGYSAASSTDVFNRNQYCVTMRGTANTAGRAQMAWFCDEANPQSLDTTKRDNGSKPGAYTLDSLTVNPYYIGNSTWTHFVVVRNTASKTLTVFVDGDRKISKADSGTVGGSNGTYGTYITYAANLLANTQRNDDIDQPGTSLTLGRSFKSGYYMNDDTGTGKFMPISLDDFRVYNGALNSDEVAWLYKGGTPVGGASSGVQRWELYE